jgi:hypothetical protein
VANAMVLTKIHVGDSWLVSIFLPISMTMIHFDVTQCSCNWEDAWWLSHYVLATCFLKLLVFVFICNNFGLEQFFVVLNIVILSIRLMRLHIVTTLKLLFQICCKPIKISQCVDI